MVGYQVRFDDRTSRNTAIKFMTDGILLAEIHGDHLLRRYDTRLALIHRELDAGWSAQQWSRARPFTSEALFQSQLFYIDASRRAGLRNVTEQDEAYTG